MTELHPDLASLAFLVGTWQGEGRGAYPTVDDFTYVEEIVIGHVGKPFLTYVQKSRHADTGLPLHGESGYYRPAGPTGIELAIAHPFGAVEVSEGAVDGQRIEMMSRFVATTTTAKEVTEVRRTIEVDGAGMHYVLDMAAVGQPLQFHLEATLHRRP